MRKKQLSFSNFLTIFLKRFVLSTQANWIRFPCLNAVLNYTTTTTCSERLANFDFNVPPQIHTYKLGPCAKMTNLICTSCLPLVCLPSRRFSCIFLFGQCNKKEEEITMTWPNASWSARMAKDGRHICQKHCRWSGELRKSGKMDGEKELELEQEQERKDICTLTKLFLFASKV